MGSTSLAIQGRLSALNAALDLERQSVPVSSTVEGYKATVPACRRKSVQFTSRPTIVFDSAFKSFRKDVVVLRNVNITVKECTVYGLYGKSSSGKTTTVQCLLGIKKLNSGHIYVRGFEAGSKFSGVPGRRVGYMPQKYGLHDHFTVRETVHFYGKLYGLKYSEVETEFKRFVKYFRIDESSSSLIKNLESNDKRLVSFIVALIHQPDILVLDEPTLGLDPVVRDLVWQYLRELTVENRTTVIIASASVNELSAVDRIGVLRGGRLVTEVAPSTLLLKYDATSLEDAILKLCLEDDKDQSSQSRWNSIGVEVRNKNNEPVDSKPMTTLLRQFSWNVGKRDFTTVFDKCQALGLKNVILAYRNWWLVLFLSILPPLTIAFLSITLTFAPTGLKFGVVNGSTGSMGNLGLLGDQDEVVRLDDCDNLSCDDFFKGLQLDGLDLVGFSSEETARDGLLTGDIYGYLRVLPEGNEMGNKGLVKVVLDTANPPLASWLQNVISTTFRSVVIDSNRDGVQFVPLLFESSTFGDPTTHGSFNSFGVALHVITFYSSLISGLVWVYELKSAKIERIFAIGVYHCDILVAHTFLMTLLLIVQTSLSFSTVFYLLQARSVGSVALAYFLTITDGFAGITLGVLIGSLTKSRFLTVLLLVAIATPSMFLSGTIVPLEGLPFYLRHIAYAYPSTMSGLGLKSVLLKGWSLNQFSVWAGFGISLAYSGSFVLITCFVHYML